MSCFSCAPVFKLLAELTANHAAEKSTGITWVPAEKAWQAARLLAHNRPASMFVWNGVGQHTNATQANRAIAILYALLGDFNRQGGNVIFPTSSINSVEGREFLPKENARERLSAASFLSLPRPLRGVMVV